MNDQFMEKETQVAYIHGRLQTDANSPKEIRDICVKF